MKKTQQKRNRLIVFEGGDGSGKGTQSDLLIMKLAELKVPTAYFDFPQYNDSFFGELTGRALRGDFGDFRHLSPYIASLSYMLDRWSAKPAIEKAMRDGIAICNRYVTSNKGFQVTKAVGRKAKREILRFIDRAEHEELGLPRPGLVIYLHVPAKVSFALVAKKNGRKYLNGQNGARDQHEKDRAYQLAAEKTYLGLVKTEQNWVQVECCDREGRMRSPQDIHEEVMALIRKARLI